MTARKGKWLNNIIWLHKLFLINYGIQNCVPSVLSHSWLGGRKGIRPVKKLSGGVLVWLFVWSDVQICIWPSWCHCHSLSLASVKSRSVLPFWYRLTRVVPDKGPLNGCVYAIRNWLYYESYVNHLCIAQTPTNCLQTCRNNCAKFLQQLFFRTGGQESQPNQVHLKLLSLQHTFNGIFSRAIWVIRYQKGKTRLDLNEASAGPHAKQLHLAPDTNTSSLNFYRPDAVANGQPPMQSTEDSHENLCAGGIIVHGRHHECCLIERVVLC